MPGRKKRVGIIGLKHESNTFIPEWTERADFHPGLTGEEMRRAYAGAHHEIAGFFEGLEAEDFEAVPLFSAGATPSGTISDAARESLWEDIRAKLREAGPIDGILASAHGAAVSVSQPDMDGWWLRELRHMIGPARPLMAVLDPHANLSRAMAETCDALISYRENPHLDQRQRGLEAASLMARTLRREIRPVVASSFPRIAINIERQSTQAEPMLSVIAQVEAVRGLPGVLSASVNMGFPYADVAEMGASFVVVTDGLPEMARALAGDLGGWLVSRRDLFLGQLVDPAEAVGQIGTGPGPLGLLDMGDNTGGGASADSTVLARLCHEEGRHNVFVCLADPESVEVARQAGTGSRVPLRMGGKASASPAPSLDAEAEVLSLHDGIFHESQPRHSGVSRYDMGPTAVVRTGRGLTVMLTSLRCPPFSEQQMLSCGLDPRSFDALILKGVHAPLGAYAGICSSFLRVNTPGTTTADMGQQTYLHRRRPLFPFEDISTHD